MTFSISTFPSTTWKLLQQCILSWCCKITISHVCQYLRSINIACFSWSQHYTISSWSTKYREWPLNFFWQPTWKHSWNTPTICCNSSSANKCSLISPHCNLYYHVYSIWPLGVFCMIYTAQSQCYTELFLSLFSTCTNVFKLPTLKKCHHHH